MKSGGDMNVLVVSHEGMASGLVKAVRMIIGPQEQLFWLELTEEGGVLPFAAELEARLNSWQKSGQSGLLFTDLLGGTPMNQAMAVTTKLDLTKKVKIISGYNLAIVLEALSIEDTSFENVDINQLLEAGKQGIAYPEPGASLAHDLDE
ncbi:PTS system, IIA component [Paenibacillus larvae subsp. larvae]|nr:hypothetical protein B5S25_00135 [Paenibacillus larvae subsp. pulvifaciens]AVF21764.1 PTS system, IIA component [Paenibacillus larvae subsp. larvae]AVG12705.1 PTS system, IIA component [Paenibacillus larvae subsp. larvae DSM 25430]ETK27542.1 PTS system, IIA component [Paenibacillus larvae subsp. larvae DSM 25719]PCK71863.1 hypothetical protein PL1_1502 [Paenibacillus larvae subsp. larvae B-3650]